jgi:hypothetical protein
VVAAHYKKDALLNCWTSSSDISGYHADFHEGHGTIGAGQGRGMTCVNYRKAWQGNGMGTAWARHAMCESAFNVHQFNIQQCYVLPTQCIYVFCVDLRTNGYYFPVQN